MALAEMSPRLLQALVHFQHLLQVTLAALIPVQEVAIILAQVRRLFQLSTTMKLSQASDLQLQPRQGRGTTESEGMAMRTRRMVAKTALRT
jgi:hypothetical protein